MWILRYCNSLQSLIFGLYPLIQCISSQLRYPFEIPVEICIFIVLMSNIFSIIAHILAKIDTEKSLYKSSLESFVLQYSVFCV